MDNEGNSASETEPEAAPPQWERRAGEPPKAWAAFCVYRDMGVGRALDRAYRKATNKPPNSPQTAPGNWRDWRSQWDWLARAQAYDAHLERMARAAKEAAHLAKLDAYNERQLKLSVLMFNSALVLAQKAKASIDNAEPESIEIKHVAGMFRAAAAMAETATNAEAQALGLTELMQNLYGGDSSDS